MRNFKIILAYDGTEFCGWQVQPDAPSIQATLASAIGRVSGEKVLPQGSGRTDAGVHALGQVASFALASAIPPANLVIALNDVLPPSIRVLDCVEVAPGFHARKSATAKTYRYRMTRSVKMMCAGCSSSKARASSPVAASIQTKPMFAATVTHSLRMLSSSSTTRNRIAKRWLKSVSPWFLQQLK